MPTLARPQRPWRWGPPLTDEPSGRVPLPGPHVVATRAVRTTASPQSLFLWLCQLRRAPYSYDWLDNFGRRSPQRADPTMTRLAVGQRFMTIFTLLVFEADRSLTLGMRPGAPSRLFGALVVEYRVDRLPDDVRQLGAILRMPASGPGAAARNTALAWGDLVMMRKQLHELRRLAERDASIGEAVR
ncbi:hypothetical protein [Agromyces soli]|uniref:Uncharacterized protein n=1 Tax=Agromyces soli TaxID=659012 RepID=A0ABY4AUF7_9MICO|nr:hypothetical protein [Agromyces soli]UOE26773.1 hypothetical protein MTP13_03045 [Agromyces soli]